MISQESLSFIAWCSKKAEQYPQFYYWSIVMKLELLMNMYIRSLQEGNFDLYVGTLNKLVPWFLALDHVHYACLLPVHIQDMIALKTMHPSIYSEFQKGNLLSNGMYIHYLVWHLISLMSSQINASKEMEV